MSARPKQLSEAEREARRRAQREELERALSALLSSEGWRRWLRTRAVLHTYSARNTILIAQQAYARGIEPTHVAGFSAWLKLGRCVRKGERGLSIWAPMRVKERDEQGEDTGEKRTLFRVAHVWDVSQTEPLDGVETAPLAAPSEPIEGDSHAHLLAPLARLAGDLGYSFAFVEQLPGGARGICRRARREILVDAGLAANFQVAVAIHELCHALIGERDELRKVGYALEEIVVESATYIACGAAGLATDVDSVPYVAGWAGESDPLQVVREAAETIDSLARLIEDAIAPRAPGEPEPAEAAP